jgi:uncharacterized protein YbjQ (UPF0145 family)
LIKQSKAGTNVREGVSCCNACGLPTEVSAASLDASDRYIPATHVTTLPTLPGYRTTGALGVVSELAAAAGFTAGMKGNDALRDAMLGLNRSAKLLGANAIVGIQATTFGAKGGITSGLGGDAVGVLLLGTAVTVEVEVTASVG